MSMHGLSRQTSVTGSPWGPDLIHVFGCTHALCTGHKNGAHEHSQQKQVACRRSTCDQDLIRVHEDKKKIEFRKTVAQRQSTPKMLITQNAKTLDTLFRENRTLGK